MEEKWVKIGYRKLEVQGKKYVWNDEEKMIMERKDFREVAK